MTIAKIIQIHRFRGNSMTSLLLCFSLGMESTCSLSNPLKRHKSAGADCYSINQLQAMEWSVDAWRELRKDARNCIRHTGIVFTSDDDY